jgi:Tol biopolymer transport system component
MALVACWRSVLVAVWFTGLWHVAAAPEPLMTVVQRDPFRSSRAPRTADVSADGRAIVFESLARLVPADKDDLRDIYLLDRTTGRVTLESDGSADDGEYSHARISGDGRYVVFESRPSTSNAPRAGIVLHDRVTRTDRVLTGSDDGPPHGWSRNPDISDDGRVVTFSSAATTLTGGTDANGALEDVYLVRLSTGAITRVSVNSKGVQAKSGNSILPVLSADGRWVAFASTAPLDDDAEPGSAREHAVRQVYLRDAIGGRTIRLTRTANRGQPNGDSSIPSITADGQRVVFVSGASNLLDNDDNRTADVFLYDREADAVTWVSRAADGSSANGESTWPIISANGRFVAFQSDAANLVCSGRGGGACGQGATEGTAPPTGHDINLLWDVFLLDRTSGRTIRISEDDLGGWMEPSVGPALGGTGEVIAFSSRHAVAANDAADDFDLFVRALTPPPAVARKLP